MLRSRDTTKCGALATFIKEAHHVSCCRKTPKPRKSCICSKHDISKTSGPTSKSHSRKSLPPICPGPTILTLELTPKHSWERAQRKHFPEEYTTQKFILGTAPKINTRDVPFRPALHGRKRSFEISSNTSHLWCHF